jgi:arylsulfatase A-like enzyme
MITDTKRPNVLLILSDQHRWCDMGCYGNSQVETPFFDRFSHEARVFTTCISNSPVCVPMRGSLMTGLYPLKHGAVTNDLPINHEVESIADVFNAAGYHTGYIGKWHLDGVPRDKPVPKERRLGFQTWKVHNCSHTYHDNYYYDEQDVKCDISGYEPEAQTSLAIDFIEQNTEAPWFLVLSWGPPHAPYETAPESWNRLYADRNIELRPNVREQKRNRQGELQYFSKAEMIEDIRGYYAHISALDEQFGRLDRALDKSGQKEQTVIAYTSDHGDMLGSQGKLKKQWPYEESIRVPLLISHEGKTVAARTEEMISLVDLPVTLLSMAGLSYKSEKDGKDLSALCFEESAAGLDACYIMDLIPCHQALGSDEWRGVRTKRYTFVRTASDCGYALFDNVLDPYQLNNLVNHPEYSTIQNILFAQLETFIDTHDKLLPPDEFIENFQLKKQWNKSQRAFSLPELK